mmetsp:Transcript_4404/g.9575  ORF Transcript_4404/g.9575 Transcript_4404/m.9575 type:complete len:290 (+) Transcript_4404:85-954(+)
MAGHPGGASSLAHRYVFGFNEDVTQNAQWADETTLVYAAGYNIVLFSMSDRKQRFIHTTLGTSENLDGFTSIAICPSRRFLAVAEKGEQPEVHVFDLKTLRKRKNLVFNDASSRCQFNSLAFTHDNENIVALAGTPEWSLVVWRWAKGKQLILKRLSDMNSPLSLFSLNPLDSETNVVMGPQFLKFYRMNETDVTQMRSQQDQLMVSRCGWGRILDWVWVSGCAFGGLPSPSTTAIFILDHVETNETIHRLMARSLHACAGSNSLWTTLWWVTTRARSGSTATANSFAF